MTATEVRLVGEGGVEWTFDLPLAEVYADQVKSHALRPADDESAAALEAAAAGDGEPEGEPETVTEPTLEDRIDAVSTHAEANELADELKVEGFEEKKPGLDAKKQALREAAAAGDGEPAA